jgi:hypothetical protein
MIRLKAKKAPVSAAAASVVAGIQADAGLRPVLPKGRGILRKGGKGHNTGTSEIHIKFIQACQPVS